MRLLNIETLQLEKFDAKNTPPYVATSHRWLAEKEEPTYQDFSDGRNPNPASGGYKKIVGFCDYLKQAKLSKDGKTIEYLWIDTCCIDKTNSSELQEAITSMYKLYRDAYFCLAYFTDVVHYSNPNGEGPGIDVWSNSVWFTRGWTLQELIAPSTVIFLSHDWTVLGHKGNPDDGLKGIAGNDLTSRLAVITPVPEDVLRDHAKRKNYSVDERMSWREGRVTERPEDIAYCMFGLFDTFLPIIYGEGREHAEKRLREEIEKDNQGAGQEQRQAERDQKFDEVLKVLLEQQSKQNRPNMEREELEEIKELLSQVKAGQQTLDEEKRKRINAERQLAYAMQQRESLASQSESHLSTVTQESDRKLQRAIVAKEEAESDLKVMEQRWKTAEREIQELKFRSRQERADSADKVVMRERARRSAEQPYFASVPSYMDTRPLHSGPSALSYGQQDLRSGLQQRGGNAEVFWPVTSTMSTRSPIPGSSVTSPTIPRHIHGEGTRGSSALRIDYEQAVGNHFLWQVAAYFKAVDKDTQQSAFSDLAACTKRAYTRMTEGGMEHYLALYTLATAVLRARGARMAHNGSYDETELDKAFYLVEQLLRIGTHGQSRRITRSDGDDSAEAAVEEDDDDED